MPLRQISPRIWQSDRPTAWELCSENGGWKAKGIKAVLCPAFNVRVPYASELHALLLPVWDDTDVASEWFEFAALFHRRFGPTLVHCEGGLNRSVVFSAALALDEDPGRVLDQAMFSGCNPVILAAFSRWAAVRKAR